VHLTYFPSIGVQALFVHSKRPVIGEMFVENLATWHTYPQQKGHTQKPLGITVPSLLVDIATSGTAMMAKLRQHVEAVYFGGAPLSEEIGEKLVQNEVNVASIYGM
jgi:hypothetical protein